jgi:hypothetical protein
MADWPKLSERELREQRLQTALRENLKRRKAQARGRAEPQERDGEPHDSAGIVEDKDD